MRRIHGEVRRVPGVQRTNVTSLASEKALAGAHGDLLVDPILEDSPVTAEAVRLAAERFAAMPRLENRLASATGDVPTVIVPVDDPNRATDVYLAVRAIAEREAPRGVDVHVAGVAAMNARLAATVDADTRLFIPMAVLVVLGVLGVALRRAKAIVGPLFVIAGSVAVAIGIMG